VLVAQPVNEGDIVGFCTAYLDIVSVRFGQRCWVEDLAAHPSWRSRGIGTLLLDAACGWARERGASHIELDSGDARHRAHQFYERRSPSSMSRCFGWTL
jgi:GNAT superfamily N-acetyltransferase